MKVNELKEKLNELHLDSNLELEEMPEIALYMDQVIQLFDGKFNDSKRNEDDKALTKTMINNYAKGKLLMSVKNKKYSKEHLILMSLIYNLKGALSINDIKTVLSPIVGPLDKGEDYPIREFYKSYLDNYKNDYNSIEASLDDKFKEIESLFSEKDLNEFEFNFLLMSSFINMSNMYRKMGEKLIDTYFDKLK
mgnify:FL=1